MNKLTKNQYKRKNPLKENHIPRDHLEAKLAAISEITIPTVIKENKKKIIKKFM